MLLLRVRNRYLTIGSLAVLQSRKVSIAYYEYYIYRQVCRYVYWSACRARSLSGAAKRKREADRRDAKQREANKRSENLRLHDAAGERRTFKLKLKNWWRRLGIFKSKVRWWDSDNSDILNPTCRVARPKWTTVEEPWEFEGRHVGDIRMWGVVANEESWEGVASTTFWRAIRTHS